jgi:hypothetical protein
MMNTHMRGDSDTLSDGIQSVNHADDFDNF